MTPDSMARMAAVQRKFPSRCRDERAQLGSVTSLTEDELRRVGQTAHKIAGLAGTLGFRNLGDAAAQLDNQIAKHADVGLPLERYIEELDNVLRDAE